MSASDETGDDVRRHIRRRRRHLRVALAVVVAVAAPTVAMLFATQVIEVVVSPPDADAGITHEEGLLLILGRRVFLVSGEGAIGVSAEGFVPRRFPLSADTGRRLPVTLAPLSGIVSLIVESNDEFLVRVDGQFAGTESKLVIELAPGTHSVSIQGPGIGLQREIEVVGRGIAQTFTFTPPEAAARPTLEVAAEPPFAHILIGGTDVGTGRYSGLIAPGVHQLEIQAEDHAPHRRQIEIPSGGGINDLGTIVLAPLPAIVSIRSKPKGATVLVDGEYRGDTPLRIEMAAGQERRVSVRKTGYQSIGDALRPLPNARIERDYDLTRTSYSARVTANRPADIAVNGRVMGSAPVTVDVGDNDVITAVAEGFRASPVRVLPGGGNTREYAFRLVEPGLFAYEAAPPETTAPSGIRLRRFAPLRFDARETEQAPPKTVELERAFYFAMNETTVAAFRGFKPDFAGDGAPDLPVASVTWQDAARFCNWLSAEAGLAVAYTFEGTFARLDPQSPGFRLPTEAEWEAVARYDYASGNVRGRPYAWGASPSIPTGFANVAGRELLGQGTRFLADHVDNHPGKAPVGTYPPNFNGIYDLGGNVSEWVNDYYRAGGFQPRSPDPLGPSSGTDRVIKGGSYLSAERAALSPGFRSFATNKSETVGFRVARWIH